MNCRCAWSRALTRKLALLAPLLLGSGCAPLGTLLGTSLMGGAFQQASPGAPLKGPTDQYRPRLVSDVPGDQQPVQVRELAFDRRGVTTTLAAAFPRRLVLRAARLTTQDQQPCSAGESAETIWLENQRRWDRPVGWSGPRVLELRFRGARKILRQPAALDFLVDQDGTTRCQRTPLGGTEPDQALVRTSRSSGGGGIGLIYTRRGFGEGPAANDDGFGITLNGSVGAWLGRWRLGGRVDLCLLDCDARSVLSIPVAAMVERLVYSGDRLTVALALGYQPGRLEDLLSRLYDNGGHRTWVHGPRAGLLLLGPRPFAGAARDQGYAARGIELFVQRQFHTVYPEPTPDDQFVARAWVFGIGFTAL